MSDSNETHQKMFDDLRDELYKRQLSNTESFDKAILSLSSAGLAISLTFLKFVIPFNKVEYIGFLYLSWVLFGSSIISTVSSLISSQVGIDKQLIYAEEYYINKNDEYLNKTNVAAIITSWLNRASAVFFVVAIISVIIFVLMNFNSSRNALLSNEVKIMSNKEVKHDGASIPKMQPAQEGATIPKIQQIQQNQSTSQSGSNQGKGAEDSSKKD